MGVFKKTGSKMIKTDKELLEKNRDDAQSMVLALTAQINLMKGKIVGMDDNTSRDSKEKQLALYEKELEGHKRMVREFDTMIKEEHKNGNSSVHTGDKQGIQS